jgi:cation:H+ antiporter
MELLAAVGLVVLGLALLAFGGDLLVRGATAIAQIAGLTPAVIGLTVVAMGTSLPELVVSLMAALGGQPDIAVGNVVGSNIFNIAAALGLTALVIPLPVHGSAVRLEWPFMFVASFLCLLLARDLVVDRLEGGFFLVALALFTVYVVRVARQEVVGEERVELHAEVEGRSLAPRSRQLAVALLVVAGGIVLLVVGGRALVSGAVTLARIAGLTERVIGLTVVAAGTSAPELATSLVAALRRRTDVAVANMIGSNIFNVLGILGVTALVAPIPVSPAIVATDMWWMLGISLMLYPMMRARGRIVRAEGAVLFGAYVTYMVLLLRGGG